MKNPIFIIIDSADGCGKGTLIKNILNSWDIKNNGPIRSFYDPGIEEGHPMNVIRTLVKTTDICAEAELMLFQACRLELFRNIQDTLNMGISVICDRSDISTMIYQGKMKDMEDLCFILRDIFELPKPDIKIVLQASFDTVTKRLEGRFLTDNPNKDKFKSNDLFRRRVWTEYNNVVRDNMDVFGLDANGSEDEVLANFYELLERQKLI